MADNHYVEVAKDSFSYCTSIGDFLSKEDPIHLNNPAKAVTLDYDIDGIVIELAALAGVKAGVHRLHLPKFQVKDLGCRFLRLRKPLPLPLRGAWRSWQEVAWG